MTKVSLHRFAGLPRRFFVSLGLGIGLLTVGAIAPPPSPTQDAAPRTPASQPVAPLSPQFIDPEYEQLPSTLNATDVLWQTAQANAPDLLPVTFYTPTNTCEGFQTQEQAIVADTAIAQIVHTLLADQSPHLLDFELAGYRVQPGPKGSSITIDFRRAADAQRHFVSLSICEQQVLFGSLRKTLVENPALNINSVRFTERGRLIQI